MSKPKNMLPIIKETYVIELAKFLAQVTTGTEIDQILKICKFPPDELQQKSNPFGYIGVSKSERLKINFLNIQGKTGNSNNILKFITEVMNPVRFINNLEHYEKNRSRLNNILGLLGWKVNSEGGLKQLRKPLSVSEISTTKKSSHLANNVDSNLLTLERQLMEMIYDYVLKTPTALKSKSRYIPEQRKKAVKIRDEYHCQLCSEKFKEVELQVDHIFPYSLGGSHSMINLMSLCEPCNHDKGKRLDYYKDEEGRNKLIENIKDKVKTLPMIENFANWLENLGNKNN